MTETPSPQQAYISKVHLKGYKSIRDLEIDFKPGLNIIIGPNGSGKTNFLEFLEKAFQLNADDIQDEIYAKIDFIIEKVKYYLDYLVKPNKISKDAQDVKIVIFDSEEKTVYKKEFLKIRNKEIHTSKKNFDYSFVKGFEVYSFLGLLFSRENNLKLIRFGVDSDFNKFFNNSFSIEFYNESINNGLSSMESFFLIIGNSKIDEEESKIIDLSINSAFLQILNTYSPIQNLKFDIDNIRIYKGVSGSKDEEFPYFEVQNLKIKFLIGGQWINWYMLSDGTKRIFYVLYKIFTANSSLVFLEEPELGIHPDQLHKLMDFLIEQSKEKQIIITTHSPEVLNAIHPDELDRIIVTRYDADKGTIMHKLTPEQAKEMGERVKEGDMFLSDRWVHLNLEDEIFNATKLNEK